jgi:hypothetical protein
MKTCHVCKKALRDDAKRKTQFRYRGGLWIFEHHPDCDPTPLKELAKKEHHHKKKKTAAAGAKNSLDRFTGGK